MVNHFDRNTTTAFGPRTFVLGFAAAVTILVLLASHQVTIAAAEPASGQKEAGPVNPQDLQRLKKVFGNNFVIIEMTADRKGEAFAPVQIVDIIELFGKAYLRVTRDERSMLLRTDLIASIRELK
jgi:hypothetical protein